MDADAPPQFPDPAHAEFDSALAALVTQAALVLKTQGRLHALITANRAITEELNLSSVLRTIVDAAVELVDAEYGAMGVIATHGGLEQFIHVGMPVETAARIGHLPEGHGLLGAVIEDPQPIRLDSLTDDPRSSGFPAEHPPMSSFLGVPVRVRDEVFGNLYLTNKRGGSFSAEDEQLVTSLASTAGVAIENARLYEESRSRQAWTAASMEFTNAVLTDSAESAETFLCRMSVDLAGADVASIIDEERHVLAARDTEDDVIIDVLPGRARRLAAAAFTSGVDRVADSPGAAATRSRSAEPYTGPMLAVRLPLAPPRVLLLGRSPERPPFTPFDARMTTDFCSQVAVAIELASARENQERLVVMEDRGRIARDLHDHVIQRLFATGLDLQSLASATSGRTNDILDNAIESLDASITQIRTVVFALTGRSTGATGLRLRLITLADEHSGALGFSPAVTFTGAIDHAATPAQADEILAVCREALSNVARHAHATTTSVNLSHQDETLRLTISDDGRGFVPDDVARRSGIANLEQRAQRLRGGCVIDSSAAGTTVRWWIPLSATANSGGTRGR
ncbi:MULTISPECIES: GAF domain-containing sensor histidine kinase [unclassified Plantibacter]|uniref:GAF domain-containing sensor histidine kinase n=1 Tax=unclassified Plantibacter TaxID=2624265 RepID=UPI00177AD142|nr:MULTISPECIES: GAF domain-containing sensor histidine kinase [unclassified Plantibacter]MBD8102835.1 GAF domain-containing sensor histidine kinase [Plantibacter sp. CFBP 8775]MBD8515696.1 GAF domain-containing sensor histidine kinase [Plantibacter sp. CFBP 8804]